MNCEILRTLYVKANGEILCNDDQGEQISLAVLDPEAETIGIESLFAGDKYSHMRSAFSAGRVPWPGVCENCAFLRPDERFGSDLIGQKVLEKIQLETSLACALKCPSCTNVLQLRSRRGSVHLPIELVAKLLTELNNAGFEIEAVEFCGQGEPLNHPRFGELVKTIQRLCPSTRLRLVTNGNHDYAAKIGACLIHETIVSIDGACQDSYAKYRVNGSLDRALTFLRDSVKAQHALGGSVVWKYILFNTNDADHEVLEAQRLADSIGVDHLWFVYGHGHMISQKFTFQNALHFPVVSNRVKLGSHPSYTRQARVWNGLGPGECLNGVSGVIWLDNFIIHTNGTASLCGWINATIPAFDQIRVAVNDGDWVDIACDIRRDDVILANPSFRQPICGFDTLIAAPESIIEKMELYFSVTNKGTEVSSLKLCIPK